MPEMMMMKLKTCNQQFVVSLPLAAAAAESNSTCRMRIACKYQLKSRLSDGGGWTAVRT